MQATLIKLSESHKNKDIKVGVRFVGGKNLVSGGKGDAEEESWEVTMTKLYYVEAWNCQKNK